MKINMKIKITCLATLIASFILHPSSLHAQGALTPPGAPAATMKSLDQIEPRTIVNATNTPGDAINAFIISQPGSYYLTTNLLGVSGKNGIEITANNVTLDLNGFAVQGVSGIAAGILLENVITNITVRNGAVSSWGSGGVYCVSASSANVVVEDVNVSANTNGGGIILNGPGVVRGCNCQNNGSGIICSGGLVSDCTADNNGGGITMISGVVSGCTANNNKYDGLFDCQWQWRERH